MSTPARITLSLPSEMMQRMQTLAERNNISQAKLVESLLELPDEAISAQVAAAKISIAARKKQRMSAKRNAVDLLSKLTPEQLAAVQKMAEGS